MAKLSGITRGLWSGFRRPDKRDAPNRVSPVTHDNIILSVVITYYAKRSTIFPVLDGLFSQSLSTCSPAQIEIIIVDDGTEGETLYKDLPPNVTYLWQRKLGEVGFGACRARNTGARMANGKYLAFLDADILVSPTYVEALLGGFQKYGDRIAQCGYIWDYFFKGCPDPRTQFGVWENPDYLTGRFFHVAAGSLAVSRNLFFESKGFDEDLIYGEVEDLLFGYQIGCLPQTAMYFNRQMECWHLPHPPSLAHAEPDKSWNVVKTKYPEFYDQYVVQGLR